MSVWCKPNTAGNGTKVSVLNMIEIVGKEAKEEWWFICLYQRLWNSIDGIRMK